MRSESGARREARRGAGHGGISAVRGFTLIELMVVIGIILLLVGLAMPVVARAMKLVEEVRTTNIIGLLGTGLEAFKQDFKFYPPSDPDSALNQSAGLTSGAEALRFYLLGGSGDGWPSGGVWPDGTPAGIAARPKGPYADGAEMLIVDDCFQDAFNPPMPILYWLADRSGTTANTIYTPGHCPEFYDPYIGVAGMKSWYDDRFYYSICEDLSGNSKPLNADSYLLVSAGEDRVFSYGNGSGARTHIHDIHAVCDDVANFEPVLAAMAD